MKNIKKTIVLILVLVSTVFSLFAQAAEIEKYTDIKGKDQLQVTAVLMSGYPIDWETLERAANPFVDWMFEQQMSLLKLENCTLARAPNGHEMPLAPEGTVYREVQQAGFDTFDDYCDKHHISQRGKIIILVTTRTDKYPGFGTKKLWVVVTICALQNDSLIGYSSWMDATFKK